MFGLGLGLGCSTTISTIFQFYRGGQLYWRRKLEKNTDPSQATDKLYHKMLFIVRLSYARAVIRVLWFTHCMQAGYCCRERCSLVSDLLSEPGLDAKKYGTHSFRTGGISGASNAGVSD